MEVMIMMWPAVGKLADTQVIQLHEDCHLVDNDYKKTFDL